MQIYTTDFYFSWASLSKCDCVLERWFFWWCCNITIRDCCYRLQAILHKREYTGGTAAVSSRIVHGFWLFEDAVQLCHAADAVPFSAVSSSLQYAFIQALKITLKQFSKTGGWEGSKGKSDISNKNVKHLLKPFHSMVIGPIYQWQVDKHLANDWRHSWCTYDVIDGIHMTSLPVFSQRFGYPSLTFTHQWLRQISMKLP